MKYKCFLILIFICVYASAQIDYRRGYIVKNNGETVTGWINFRGNVSNGKQCYFKKDSLSEAVRYLPEDLIAYRFNDSKYYVRKKIQSETGEKILFLECLISGKTTIYYSEQEFAFHYYIEKDSIFKEINDNEVPFEDADGHEGFRKTNQYKGVLKYCFSDCPVVFRKVDNATFEKKSLIKLSKVYHENVCKGQKCIIYEKSFPKRMIRFGMDFSYGFGSLTFKYDDDRRFYFHPACEYWTDVFVLTNLDEDNRTFLQFSAGYNFFKSQPFNLSTGVPFYMGHPPVEITYQYSLLKLMPSILYKVPLKKICPFFSVGAYMGFFLSDEGISRETNSNNTKYFTRSGFKGELEKDRVVYGGNCELGCELPFFSTQKNVFFSIHVEKLLVSSTMKSKNLWLRTGIYF